MSLTTWHPVVLLKRVYICSWLGWTYEKHIISTPVMGCRGLRPPVFRVYLADFNHHNWGLVFVMRLRKDPSDWVHPGNYPSLCCCTIYCGERAGEGRGREGEREGEREGGGERETERVTERKRERQRKEERIDTKLSIPSYMGVQTQTIIFTLIHLQIPNHPSLCHSPNTRS